MLNDFFNYSFSLKLIMFSTGRALRIIISSHAFQIYTFDKRTIHAEGINSSIANPQMLEAKLYSSS